MRLFIIFLIVATLFFGCTNKNDEDNFSLEEKGDIAFARREYQKAANDWNKASERNSRNSSLLNKLGDCYLKLGRLGRAEFFYKKAVEINPDNVDIQVKLAQIYILTWNLPEADKICVMLNEKNLSYPELDLIRADISLMTNEFDKAETFYRKAVIGSKDSLRTLMKLAIFLKSINKHEEAVEIFHIVKKNHVVSSPIFLLMADYYLLDNQYDQAEQAMLDAIRIEPEDNSLKYHLVQFYIGVHNFSKAETLLENMLKNQDDIYLRMMLSDVYISNEKLKQAETIISELKKEITEPIGEFELLQGKFWLYSGKSIYATSHLKSALELRPGLVNTRYLLGLTYLINGKSKLSENSLMATLRIHPNHYKALLLISELLYRKEEYELSLKYLERLLENFPEDFTGHIFKGLNLIGLDQYLPAKNEFNTSIFLSNSKAYISYYYLGLTEEFLNNGISALDYYKQVLAINPEFIDASYRYCMLLLKMNQNKSADDFINQMLATRKNSPEVYYLAAKVALNSGNFEKGEGFLKKAIDFESVPGFIFIELANYYKNTGKTEKSIETLKECANRKPKFQDAWLAMSKLYIDHQDLSSALEIMQEGYKEFQDMPIFQSNLAWLLLENNQDINQALSLAQSAYEKMPDNIAFADTLGWAYYYKGIYSQALWLLSEAQKKEPNNGFVRYHLGMTYYQQGDIDKASMHLKLAQQSEESKYFFHEIDTVFSELLKAKPVESNTNTPEDNSSILSPPGNGNIDNDVIIPQWKR